MTEVQPKIIALPKAIRQYVRMVLGWVTIITSGFVFVFKGPSGFFRDWPISITIALVTATLCYWGVHAISWIEGAILRARFRSIPKHGHLWYFLLTALLLPVGIHLGLSLAAIVANSMDRTFSQPNWADYRYSLLFGLLVFGIMLLIEMQRDSKLSQKEAELRLRTSENARLKAQIAGLTAQMNPHLLFNALNTIASLIKSNPDAAEEMTVRVSDMLRSRLQAGRQDMHSLEQELEICANYLEIEKQRFGDRLKTKVDISDVDASKTSVPVLCIQPFVENAIKYAVSPRASGGKILINAHQSDGITTISVTDDGPGLGKSSVSPGSQTSIENCRRRLELHYGDDASLVIQNCEGGGCSAVLKIPQQSTLCEIEMAKEDRARRSST